jgi:hypothetical protein
MGNKLLMRSRPYTRTKSNVNKRQMLNLPAIGPALTINEKISLGHLFQGVETIIQFLAEYGR